MGNMGLRAKLMGGFAVLALLGLFTALFGGMGIRAAGDSAEEISGNYLPSIVAITGADMALNETAIQALLLANPRTPLDIRKQQYGFDAQFAGLEAAWAPYIAFEMPEEEKNLVKSFSAGYETYKKKIALLAEAARQKDVLLDAGVAAGDARIAALDARAWSAYMEAHAAFELAMPPLDRLKDINVEESAEAAKHAHDELKRDTLLLSIFTVISFVLAIALGWFISQMAVNTLRQINNAAHELAKGNLSGANVTHHSGDEFGELADTFRSLVDAQRDEVDMLNAMAQGDFSRQVVLRSQQDELNRALQGMVENTNQVIALAQRIADGDLTVTVETRSDADELSRALAIMVKQMHSVLDEVNVAVGQVATGANQISGGTQALSNAATESAASLEEISASITEIGSQAKSNADNAHHASTLANAARGSADRGNKAVEEMLVAMTAMQESGHQIAKVVKLIDDIAFQTNVLSLNAAVEAARAGKHGKGFAVVADAVRALANRSATAAKDTSALVENTIKRMEENQDIANRTAEILNEIVTNSVKVADLVGEISAASNEQAQGVGQINQGLSQLNQVTQQVAANSEESAAAAEELSGQAVELQRLMTTFTLDEGSGSHAAKPAAPRAALPPASRRAIVPKGGEAGTKFIAWSRNFQIGVPQMDEQHRTLVELINNLHDAMRSGADEQTLATVLEGLMDYTKHHFADEERYQASVKFPDLAAHKKLHTDLMNRVKGFEADFRAGKLNTVNFMRFLKDWLLNHIESQDKRYARHAADTGAGSGNGSHKGDAPVIHLDDSEFGKY